MPPTCGKTITSYFARRFPSFNNSVGEICVGNSVGIERGAPPAFILRARPGMNVADARNGEVVRLHLRRGGQWPMRKARDPSGMRRALPRSPLGMMIAPARNLCPPSSKSSSAACIFVSAFLKRNVTMLLSAVFSTTTHRSHRPEFRPELLRQR